MRSGLSKENLVGPEKVAAPIHLNWCEVGIHKTVQALCFGSCLEVANEGVVILTEFRQPLQVQSHLEMPGILVQLGHTQRT